MTGAARATIVVPALALLAAAAVMVLAASAQPYAIAVVGVMVLGPAHVVLACRYLVARVAGSVSESTGLLLAGFVVGMVFVRLAAAWSPVLGQRLELVGSMAVITVAAWLGLRGRARWLVLVIVAVAAFASFAHLPWYWHLLMHSHNIVPLVFLWDWARRHRSGTGLAFAGLNLIWAVGIPALILVGALDRFISGVVPEFIPGLIDPAFVLSAAAPPHADPALALRFLVVFTYMQLMHYVLWMVFFQVAGRRELGALAARVPWTSGWRLAVLVLVASALIWVAYAVGYTDGRAVYGILGAANVYLEQPIAIWVLLAALPARATSGLTHRIAAARS